ncbi:hypothetical protein M422DRAFT_785117 [Sphaerobolus stellatus SS14]|uniref:Cytochrome P450 n=1 Tax=Sphaerobolus stellatus (strain SS14) TaxID=990650 RepID=A0A0C9UCG4_SPHS4|nr:hypothetical protein M422DRAFT_785117 [Sphaerobolus stellatus SS14]
MHGSKNMASNFIFSDIGPLLIPSQGDMVYYRVFGQGILALGSVKRCHDLFDKRSSIYSSRPENIMLNKLSGWNFALGSLSYGISWRKHRRAFQQYFNANVVLNYRPVQLKSAHGLLRQLLKSPDAALTQTLRSSFAEIIMEVVYGYKVAPMDDPYIKITECAVTALLQATKPGKFLDDTFPFLQYIPSWVPGAGFKKLAEQWRVATMAMVEDPFDWTKSEITRGTAKPSIVASMLQKISDQPDSDRNEFERIMKNAAGIAFAGGTDTTIAAVTCFFLAMAMFPEVQKKAQREIDSVIGTHRLPDFSDRDSLPYINAIIKEAMRWQTIVPINGPHFTTEDDFYEGYFIPKGTIVLGCTWTILHDPAIYEDPHEFKPERFIKDGKFDSTILDPYVGIFGYGRRICPGRYFADDTAYIMIASILATFNISAPLDEMGRPKTLVCDMQDGLVSHPRPFDCVIKSRSSVAMELIQDPALAL